MARAKRWVGPSSTGLTFRCPGCNERHSVRTSGEGDNWSWNGSEELPTFSPSVLMRSGHFIPGHVKDGDGCWCRYNREHPDKPAPFECCVCHSFVTDGRIQFLGDCTHALAGQTVDLPELTPR